jgi:hypothetical protein
MEADGRVRGKAARNTQYATLHGEKEPMSQKLYEPSFRARARSCLTAATTRIELLLEQWDKVSDAEFDQELEAARRSMTQASDLIKEAAET